MPQTVSGARIEPLAPPYPPAIGKVTRLSVQEGDYVEQGEFLLQIDPTDFQSTVDRIA